MSINLLDTAKGFFNNELVGKASNVLGESESGIQKALSGIIPAVFAGILAKVNSGSANTIHSLATGAAEQGVTTNMSDVFGGGLVARGAEMLRGLFGEKTNEVSTAVATYSGIRPASATSLLGAAAPVALATIGNHLQSTGVGSSGLASLLTTQKDAIMNALPSGLNLGGILGFGALGAGAQTVPTGTTFTSEKSTGARSSEMNRTAVNRGSGVPKWLIPAIIILAALGLLWFAMRSRKPAEQTHVSAITSDSTPAVAPQPNGSSIKVKLPDGTELDAYKGGIEDRLVAYLNDKDSKIDKSVWFDFDKLNFETGSAKITTESDKQVQNIHAILKAFPKVEIKIGGYTDRTGDSTSNLKLSQARADVVMKALKANSDVASQVVGAEGYGSQFAKAAAGGSEDEKKMDRRISVNVRKK